MMNYDSEVNFMRSVRDIIQRKRLEVSDESHFLCARTYDE